MWLDRTLFQGPRLALVASQQAFRRVLREIGCDGDVDPHCEPGWHACTHAYEVGGELVCIVGVDLQSLARMEPIDAAAVLVHEAVHVWQRTRARLGPGDLGVEMEAYAVQNIAAALMRAFVSAPSSAPAA